MIRGPAGLAALALLLGIAPSADTAPQVVVYRCVAADGAVTLQNDRRCAKGMRQERRVLDVPTTRATPAAPDLPKPAPAPAAMAVPATAPVVEVPPAPAPMLFACRTWEGQRYFGDAEQPAPRCAPLETVGLDGRSTGVAEACEVVADTCEPVPEATRCEAWGERLRAAENAERFGEAVSAVASGSDATRIRAALAGTVCAAR